MNRNLFLLTLLLFSPSFWILPVYAQQGSITINGKITAAEDAQPVAQASIRIDRKGVGTATNALGAFALIIPANNLADSLKISCIGFKTKTFAINKFKNGDELNIALEKNTTELKEVKIVYYDAQKIIQKAIDRIPENYINHPHILRGFYRMYTFNESDPLQLSEAVFDVYNYGYADKHADLFRLIKARNEKNTRDFNSVELGQKPNSIFEDDIINHINVSGFLNDAGLKKHQFEVAEVVDFQGYQAYQIDFKEKPGITEGTFRGRMYIDTKTYAFIYFDYGMSPSGINDGGLSTFLTHTMVRAGGVEIDLKQDHATVSYQEVGHQWVLSSMAGNNVLSVKSPEAANGFTANVKFNYQVTAVDTVAKESFSSKIGRNESLNNHASDTGSKFWKDYNILLSDYNTEDIFNLIQDINKTSKQKTN
ncbi:MAG TPA: carboxypeptidase-like regulatory domain-containing protein [Mucilaginibacter sp.]|nr:carboxypeptidase-like regulatory domain-containing protein [Mucilaginibacter sp.]